jgi:hypothetical protein
MAPAILTCLHCDWSQADDNRPIHQKAEALRKHFDSEHVRDAREGHLNLWWLEIGSGLATFMLFHRATINGRLDHQSAYICVNCGHSIRFDSSVANREDVFESLRLHTIDRHPSGRPA